MNLETKFQQKLSLEVFPSRTKEGFDKLKKTIDAFNKIDYEYVSVTYGAGGTTQEKTIETVSYIQKNTPFEATPHLTCIGSSKKNIESILKTYSNLGIKRIVALRGDIPSGMLEPGEFKYAKDLVKFIRETTGDEFKIEVAAYPETHPQARNCEEGIKYFKEKINCGVNSAITQYFFNTDSYFYFIDSCEKSGIDIPIIPGIMPITNYEQLIRFSSMCGAEVPRWLKCRLESFSDDKESLLSFGKDYIINFCQKLLDSGAPGLHFYSMNQINPTLDISRSLTLK